MHEYSSRSFLKQWKARMLTTHILGYPRIGAQRELKHALEAFWNSNRGDESLQDVGRNLRASNWTAQEAAGLGFITAGDFSFYDHMLDHAVLLGCAFAVWLHDRPV